jgi:opacity protein-like surface antigen
MKRLLIAVATLATLSTTAMAEDFDNPTVVFTMKTKDYFIQSQSPQSGADQFTIGGKAGPIDSLSLTLKNNSDTQDWKVQANKKVKSGPAYAGAKGAYWWGDSFTANEQVHLTPYVGVAKKVGKFTPFAEVGMTWKSTRNDVMNFDKKDSYIDVGSSYALTDALSLKLSVKDSRDTSFKSKDNMEAKLGITVKF